MVDCVVGPLRLCSDFDSGNLEDAFLTDPLATATAASSTSEDGCCSSGSSGTPVGSASFGSRPFSFNAPQAPSIEIFLKAAPDCSGTVNETEYRSWFHFAATYVGPPELPAPSKDRRGRKEKPPIQRRVIFTIVNMKSSNRIFDNDNRPVFCVEGGEWERLPNPLVIVDLDKHGKAVAMPKPAGRSIAATMSYAGARKKFNKSGTRRISWEYTFSCQGETVRFATNFPLSYRENLIAVDALQEKYGYPKGLAISQELSPPQTVQEQTQRQRSSRSTSATKHNNVATPPRAPRPSGDAQQVVSAPLPPPSPPQQQRSAPPPPPPRSSGGIYFQRETLCFSVKDKRVDLLTITGPNEMAENREPFITSSIPVRSNVERPHEFPTKKIVLLTARVHPGETPGSHVLTGVIDFLLNTEDPRAAALRDHFVFKIVPMLNPDGVAMGHYRMDSRGENLNRMYVAPDLALHPTIHATRELVVSLAATGRLVLYVDMHAHASKRGCFVFGNAWDDETAQLNNLLYPKLLSINTPFFDFTSCDFTSRSMGTEKKVDGKYGTGRVALATQTGLVHCYTLEASYNMGLTFNTVPALNVREASGGCSFINNGSTGGSSNNKMKAPLSSSSSLKNTLESYYDVGRAVVVSILDMYQLNPVSRLCLTPYRTLHGVKGWLERQLHQLLPEQELAEVESTYSMKKVSKREWNRQQEIVSTSLMLPMLNSFRTAAKLSVQRKSDSDCQEEEDDD